MSNINPQTIVLVLDCDWAARPGKKGLCAFDNVQVTDGTNVLGEDMKGRPGWRINVQSTQQTTLYNPVLTIKLNIKNIVFPANLTGTLTFNNADVTPAIINISDPFGTTTNPNPLPSTYLINNGATPVGPIVVPGLNFQIFSRNIQCDGDWEWAVTLAVSQDNATKTFSGDPEMEVGDLGMPATA